MRAVVFMVFVAPWLGQHLSWALFVISIVLILATVSLLFATALTNPGYLPRDTESPDEDIEWGCAPRLRDYVNTHLISLPLSQGIWIGQ